MIEKTIVSRFLCPTLLTPPSVLSFNDQFAFRPSGSTAAALITKLHKINHILEAEPYVIVKAIDFSKAFDCVRYAALMEKMAQPDIPDHVYNWIVNFFNGHSHCVQFRGDTSSMLETTASIIQGSAIGPASYVATKSDLRTVPSRATKC
jgi:hypothetical protein